MWKKRYGPVEPIITRKLPKTFHLCEDRQEINSKGLVPDLK